MDRDSQMTQALNTFIRKGQSVFPVYGIRRGICECSKAASCGSPGKHPKTPNGFHDASVDLIQLHAWFPKGTQSNIGFPTGKKNQVVIVDVDPRNGGLDSMKKIEERKWTFPRSPTVETGRNDGGFHIYLSLPDSKISMKSGNLLPGIDLKGEGGYVVVPPSLHMNGGQYRWKDESENIPYSQCPRWLVDFINFRSQEPGKKMISYRNLVESTVEDGTRNAFLTSCFGYFLAKQIKVELAVELVFSLNKTKCKPPLSTKEVTLIIGSILKREINNRETP